MSWITLFRIPDGCSPELAGLGQVWERKLLFRLIDKKSGFEWQRGVLVSWDRQKMRLMVSGQPEGVCLGPDALILIGDLTY